MGVRSSSFLSSYASVTHGCIVSLIKLFLPDGLEARRRSEWVFGLQDGSGSLVDLHVSCSVYIHCELSLCILLLGLVKFSKCNGSCVMKALCMNGSNWPGVSSEQCLHCEKAVEHAGTCHKLSALFWLWGMPTFVGHHRASLPAGLGWQADDLWLLRHSLVLARLPR